MLILNKEISNFIIKPLYFAWMKLRFRYISQVEKTITLKIEDINFWYQGNRYNEVTFPGIIKGGDWSDRITYREKTLRNLSKYRSVIQRYSKGIPWPETALFKQRYASLFKNGERVKGCENLDELEKHYEKTYDRLFEDLKKNGILLGDWLVREFVD